MLIDFHTHILPPRFREERACFADRDPCFALLYSQPKAKIATAEELLESMDRDGVDISVVQNIGWTSQELCVITNDYILESVARYSRRLIGFVSVQPAAGDEALKELERCARAGARGVGELRPDTQGIDLTAPERFRLFMDQVQRLGLILLLHASEPVGHDYPGKGRVTPELLYPFILAYPGVRIVLAHWGGGLLFYTLMPEVARALANVYFDTAATPYLYRKDIFLLAPQFIGWERVLFGSDFPLMPQRRPISDIKSLGLDRDKEKMILGGNAAALLGMGE